MVKKGLLALGLLIASSSVFSAQPPQEQPEAWAAKMFGVQANLVHDFGSVPRGAQLHHDFVLINIYAVPIQITSIRFPGCTLPAKATTHKHILRPKEKGTISVQMDASRFRGQRSGRVFVTVETLGSTPSTSTVALTVTAISFLEELAFGGVSRGLLR